MGIKVYKPRTPGRRNMSGHDFKEITKSKPEKSLTAPIKRTGARGNNGRCLLYTSPSPRDATLSRMPSSA